MLTELERTARRNHARHYLDCLIRMVQDELAGRHEAAIVAFDREWQQIQRAHAAAVANPLDDGHLAWGFFMFGTEFRRRRRPAAELEFGVGAALRYTKGRGRLAHVDVLLAAARAAIQTSRLGRARAHLRAALRLLRRPIDTVDDEETERLLSEVLASLANVELQLGHADESRSACQEAYAIAERRGHEMNQCVALGNLGNALATVDDLDGATVCYARAYDIARQRGDIRNMQAWATDIASLRRRRGLLDGARRFANEAIALARHIGDHRAEARSTIVLAAIAHDAGDDEEAAELQQSGLKLAGDLGDQLARADALAVAAAREFRDGYSDRARQTRRQILDILDRTGRSGAAATVRSEVDSVERAQATADRFFDVVGRMSAAQRLAGADRLDDAVGLLGELIAELRMVDEPRLLSLALGVYAPMLEHAERPGEALAAYDEALAVDDGDSAVVTGHLLARAGLIGRGGNIMRTLAAHEEVVHHCRRVDERGEPLGSALVVLGQLARQMRAYESALRAYAEALEIFRTADAELAETIAADIEAIHGERDRTIRKTAHGQTVLSRSKVREALEEIMRLAASEPQLTVVVRLTDGNVVGGQPNMIIVGVVPCLMVSRQDAEMLLPLEWLTEIALIADDRLLATFTPSPDASGPEM